MSLLKKKPAQKNQQRVFQSPMPVGAQGTPSLATESVVQTIRTGQVLLDRVQRICRRYGLTLSTANALAIIDGAETLLSPCVIQERLLVTSGAVTQILDALEQRKLIRRVANPHDRRSVLIEITSEGQQLRRESEPYLNRRDQVWMQALAIDEQAQLVGLLQKVYAHLEATPEDEVDVNY